MGQVANLQLAVSRKGELRLVITLLIHERVLALNNWIERYI